MKFLHVYSSHDDNTRWERILPSWAIDRKNGNEVESISWYIYNKTELFKIRKEHKATNNDALKDISNPNNEPEVSIK